MVVRKEEKNHREIQNIYDSDVCEKGKMVSKTGGHQWIDINDGKYLSNIYYVPGSVLYIY